jgi:hypothetical protein
MTLFSSLKIAVKITFNVFMRAGDAELHTFYPLLALVLNISIK